MRRKAAYLIALVVLVAARPGFGATIDEDALVERLVESATGDLPEIQERHAIRVLVTHDRTRYFLTGKGPVGFDVEMFREYEKHLNRSLPKGQRPTRVYFVPVPFEDLLPSLIRGKGDIACAGLTITPERKAVVDFADPYIADVEEIVVTSPDLKDIHALDDLAGRDIFVLAASSYSEHLDRLNDDFRKRGLKPVTIYEADRTLTTEDILELVNAGIIDLTVADRHTAETWKSVLDRMVLRHDLVINHGGQIAWAVRKNNPELRENLNQFAGEVRKGTLIGNILFKRYYEDTKWISNPLAASEVSRLGDVLDLIRKYSDLYDFDWRLVAAIAYQESKLNPNAHNRSGAVGIMQVLPSTAADPAVGIADVTDIENNIHAGVKILHNIRTEFAGDPELSDAAALDFTIASYNAGPNRIQNLRRKARIAGLDPNAWYFDVERMARKTIGKETTRYVSNVNKYYIAYRLYEEMRLERDKKIESIADSP